MQLRSAAYILFCVLALLLSTPSPAAYDDLHRLVSYTRDGQTTSFNYDDIGNITLNQEMGLDQYVYFGDTRPVSGPPGGRAPIDLIRHPLVLPVSSSNGLV